MAHLLPAEPIPDLDAYTRIGGGRALAHAQDLGPAGVIDVVRRSGLRGHGGAGFPTGFKWNGLATSEAALRFVVCNAAEGEPGTFKDRLILRRNPYQVLEGLAVGAFATGAAQMFVGIKSKFAPEIAALERAAQELAGAGLLGDAELVIVRGPDDYLFGEEKALLEVIEGRDPLPRLFPPYTNGLFERPNGPVQPAAVNNVETLATVPHILGNGPDWYRSLGTTESPGTVVCSVGGDVAIETVVEVEMGTTLRTVIERDAGGVAGGRSVALVLNGVSNAPLRDSDLDVPISFEHLAGIGSGLGSAGFTVYDETACPVKVATAASGFLYRGSCGQCTPCKLGTGAITEAFLRLDIEGTRDQIDTVAAWALRVTDANRCGLGAGQQALARGVLERFPESLAHHLDGSFCPSTRSVPVPSIEDYDPVAGRFKYAPPLVGDIPGS